MAFAVWAAQTTIGTTAIPDISIMKKADVLTLPWWYQVVVKPTSYPALNSKAITAITGRWRIRKG